MHEEVATFQEAVFAARENKNPSLASFEVALFGS
jgi:hypothetical protein